MPKKKVYRSAGKKVQIVAYSDKHGVHAAASYFRVTSSQVYKWREIRAKLQKQAIQEPDRQHVETTHVRPVSQPPPAPSTQQAITGLGVLIADIRQQVVSEIAEHMRDVLGTMIDDRMPGIVSRELRKLLDEGNPAKKKEEPALRAVKSA